MRLTEEPAQARRGRSPSQRPHPEPHGQSWSPRDPDRAMHPAAHTGARALGDQVPPLATHQSSRQGTRTRRAAGHRGCPSQSSPLRRGPGAGLRCLGHQQSRAPKGQHQPGLSPQPSQGQGPPPACPWPPRDRASGPIGRESPGNFRSSVQAPAPPQSSSQHIPADRASVLCRRL